MPTRAERQAAAAYRRAQVLQARLAGASFEDIGRQLGVSDTRAHQLYVDAMRRTVREPADQLRAAEVQRLDLLQLTATRVLRAAHVVIQGGRVVVDPQGRPYPDHGPTLQAAAVLLRIAERRAKLLGLDAPAKVDAQLRADVYSLSAIDDELARLHAELGALGPPDPPVAEQDPTGPPAPPAPTPAAVDVGGLVAGALDAALDAAGIPAGADREAAYAAAARLLAEADS